VTTQLLKFAQVHCQGRIVSMLEGGYALSALGRSVTEHVRALAELG
jgi:acetoin utilization deacetylase AcuC-like enzyme